jgi:hypothetical protein
VSITLISLEPGWYVQWVSSTDTVVGPAMTQAEAMECEQAKLRGCVDEDLAGQQAQRNVLRALQSRDIRREDVARFNRNGPRGGVCKLETIIRQTHRQREQRGGADQ